VSKPTALLQGKDVFYAGLGGSACLLLSLFGVGGRRRIGAFMMGIMLMATVALPACRGGGTGGNTSTSTAVNHTVSGLRPQTTYYWKVTAQDDTGATAESAVRSFTTH
jgi:hypothetical protein